VAFQGGNTPDFAGIAQRKLQLALQMRAQRQRDEAAVASQRLAKIKAISDARTAQLGQTKLQLEIDKSLRENAAGVASAQGLAAQEFTPQDVTIQGSAQDSRALQSILSQNDPQGFVDAQNAQQNLSDVEMGAARARSTVSGGTLEESLRSVRGGAAASRFDQQRETAGVVDTEDRAEARKIASENRAERRKQALDRRAEDFKIDAEQRARVNDGNWVSGDLNSYRKDRERELAFVPDIARDRRRLENINARDPLAILELIQRWQKRVDEGAVVRESDIALIKAVGASGLDNFFSSAKSMVQIDGSLPAGFGQKLKDSFSSMLGDEEIKALDLDSEMRDYAEKNGWSEAQKNRALPLQKQLGELRARNEEQEVQQEEQEVQQEEQDDRRARIDDLRARVGPPKIWAEYRRAVDYLMAISGKTESELLDEDVFDAHAILSSSGVR